MNPSNHPIYFVASSVRFRNVFPYTSWSRYSLASRTWANLRGSNLRLLFRIFSRTLMFSALLMSLSLPLLGVVSVATAEIGSSDPAQSSFQLVPCDPTKADQPCNYNAFIIGIQRIIKACILFAVPIAAGVFGWFGLKMMTAGGDTKGREAAKEAMLKVLKGMFLMLAAWYVVDLALGGLLAPEFKSGLQK